MKRYLLVLLALVTVNGFALSLKQNNFLMQGATAPIYRVGENAKKTLVITVDEFGVVTGARCDERMRPLFPNYMHYSYFNCTGKRILDTLSRYEIYELGRLIATAKEASIVYPDPRGLHCLAIPTERFRYTANNGQVLLSSGSRPCGRTTYNDSDAARAMIQNLEEYEAEYHRGSNE